MEYRGEFGGGIYLLRIRLMRRVIYLSIFVGNSCMAVRNWGSGGYVDGAVCLNTHKYLNMYSNYQCQ